MFNFNKKKDEALSVCQMTRVIDGGLSVSYFASVLDSLNSNLMTLGFDLVHLNGSAKLNLMKS